MQSVFCLVLASQADPRGHLWQRYARSFLKYSLFDKPQVVWDVYVFIFAVLVEHDCAPAAEYFPFVASHRTGVDEGVGHSYPVLI